MVGIYKVLIVLVLILCWWEWLRRMERLYFGCFELFGSMAVTWNARSSSSAVMPPEEGGLDYAQRQDHQSPVGEQCLLQSPPIFVRTNDALHLAAARLAGKAIFIAQIEINELRRSFLASTHGLPSNRFRLDGCEVASAGSRSSRWMKFARSDGLRPAEKGWWRGVRGFWLAGIGELARTEAFWAAGIEASARTEAFWVAGIGALARTEAFRLRGIGAEICTGRFLGRRMGGAMEFFAFASANFLAVSAVECLIGNIPFVNHADGFFRKEIDYAHIQSTWF